MSLSTIMYTQRIDIIKGYGERRNSSDKRWAEFILRCGYLPVPVVNHSEAATLTAEQLAPVMILLTGGNNLMDYNGDAPERDATETALIKYAIDKQIPILGVCRGMQMLQAFFGGTLENVECHVSTFHKLAFNGEVTQVNSYHNLGIEQPAEGFLATARCDDGVIEAMEHSRYNIKGIMWHPEREQEFRLRDIKLVQNMIEGGTCK